ncbi:MAG: hypothetical protein ACK5GN_10530 [Pseudomonadota bacterium]|jgi:uncharacterized protein
MDVAQYFDRLKQHPAVKEALDLLRGSLPTALLYHAYSHTEDVLYEVVQLASADNLSLREIELLGVAAAWHDVGFIWSRNSNESLGANALRSFLLSSKLFSSAEIETMVQMILDTALVVDGDSFKQVATTPLSCYLLDADLANFGRDDFFEKSELQRRELGDEVTPFRIKTLALLRNHTWLTPAASKRWQTKKDANLAKLAKLVAGH